MSNQEKLVTPKKSPSKTGSSAISHLRKIDYATLASDSIMEKALYSFREDDFLFEFIYAPKKDAKKLFVMLSGYAERGRIHPPVFQRWSWSEYFPGSCLYISDPSLHCHDDLGIGWYVGNNQINLSKKIAALVADIAQRQGFCLSDVIFYGSSGGAFASLQIQLELADTTVVAINPQTRITAFKSRHVKTFLDRMFDGLSPGDIDNFLAPRISLLTNADLFKKRKIVYAQNLLDEHHYTDHFLPFMNALSLDERDGYSSQFLKTIFFENEGGHGSGESKDIFPKLISQAIELSDSKL